MKVKNQVMIGCWQNQYYLWNDEPILCAHCLNDVHDLFILKTFQHKFHKGIFQKTYCTACANQIENDNEGTKTLVIIEFPLPKNIIPVLPEALIVRQVQNSNSLGGVILSDKEFDDDVKAGVQLINHCKVAFNPNQSRQDLPDYYEKYKEIESKLNKDEVVHEVEDKALKVDDGLKLLDSLAKAEPVKETFMKSNEIEDTKADRRALLNGDWE